MGSNEALQLARGDVSFFSCLTQESIHCAHGDREKQMHCRCRDGKQQVHYAHRDVVRGVGMHRKGICNVRYVVKGKRVMERQARAHEASSGGVCVVPELRGGGCGMSVSACVMCVSMYLCVNIIIFLFITAEKVCRLA